LVVVLAIIPAVAVHNKEHQAQSGAMRPENLERESPLEDRIGSAPDSFLKQFDGEPGVKVSPHVVTTAERMVVAMALSDLTSVQRGVLRERLHSIYFIDGLPNNALTYPDDDKAAEPVYNIAVRAGVLDESISELVTRKEQTLFDTTGSDISVNVDAGNLDAIVYVLLHEATHIVDASLGVTRDVKAATALSPLVNNVWSDSLTPVEQYRQPLLMKVRYRHDGHVLPISKAPDVYDALGLTPFISVYGSTNWHDDLAELVAWTQLTGCLHQPYRISIRKGTKVIRTIEPEKSNLVHGRLKYLAQLSGTQADSRVCGQP